jgi:guanine nucleotide exchange factor VAV
LSQHDADVIFYGIEALGRIHAGFHSDLMKASSNRDSAISASSITIADCFIKWKEKFLIYGEFCSNLPKAQDLVDKLCQKDPTLLEAITNCQISANKAKFRLRDLLSVPMQRVLKYHLLLKVRLFHKIMCLHCYICFKFRS